MQEVTEGNTSVVKESAIATPATVKRESVTNVTKKENVASMAERDSVANMIKRENGIAVKKRENAADRCRDHDATLLLSEARMWYNDDLLSHITVELHYSYTFKTRKYYLVN